MSDQGEQVSLQEPEWTLAGAVEMACDLAHYLGAINAGGGVEKLAWALYDILSQQLAEAQPEVALGKGANSGSAVAYDEPDEFGGLPDVERYSEHAGGSWTQVRQ